MSAIGLADALAAAPRGQASAARPGRESGTRFGEVLTAAGVDFRSERADAGTDDASTRAADGLATADTGSADAEDASRLLTATSLALVPTIVLSEAAATADAGTAETAAEEASGAESGSTKTGAAETGDVETVPLTASTAETTVPVHGLVQPVASASLPVSPLTGRDVEPAPSATSASIESPPSAPSAHVTPGSPGVSVQTGLADGASTSIEALPLPASALAAGTSAPSVRADRGAVASVPIPSTASAATAASPAPTPASSAGAAIRADDGVSAPALSTPTVAVAAPATPSATATPVYAATPASPVTRAVAAQVSPVVVSIAQRPSGTHQLTMTVNPDSLGPVTIRAHIGHGGDVRVELFGATDAGRDALRAIVTDLRRDLAGAMPHATLSIAQGTGADAGAERGGQASAGSAGEQGATGRDSGRDAPGTPSVADTRDLAPQTPATTTASIPGSGLDILA